MINDLYNYTHEIPEKMKYTNKYTFLGYNNIVDVRYLDVNDVLTNFKALPISTYISTQQQVLLFPNRVDNEIVDMLVRPLNSKAGILKLGHKTVPYGIGQLSENFKFGDTLILVEGIADLGALKLLKRDLNVIAMQSNKLSKAHYSIIAGLTNNVILLVDNDKAGAIAAYQMIKELKDYDVTAVKVNQYSNLKDTGDILDKLMEYTKTKDPDLKEEIKLIKMYYLSQLQTR